jgi:uncharacterized protein (DUF302 family)
MITRIIRTVAAAALALGLIASVHAAPNADDGVVRIKSQYPMDETIRLLEEDIASKGITFFLAVDQAKLAADAGIELRPSTLLIFGNPALGTHFITADPDAGLDWPVRLLVTQESNGEVWVVYTDFAWIARRHGITERDAQFKMASEVIASITSSVAGSGSPRS